MLQMLHRRHERDGGFTLIELMVVVLIIAILIAIAIPTFLGARKRAADRAAQSNLRNALTTEKTFYSDSQTYSAEPATLKGVDANINFVTATPAVNEVQVQLAEGTTDVVCLTATSGSGTTFGIKDIATGDNAATYYMTGPPTTCDTSITSWSKTGF